MKKILTISILIILINSTIAYTYPSELKKMIENDEDIHIFIKIADPEYYINTSFNVGTEYPNRGEVFKMIHRLIEKITNEPIIDIAAEAPYAAENTLIYEFFDLYALDIVHGEEKDGIVYSNNERTATKKECYAMLARVVHFFEPLIEDFKYSDDDKYSNWWDKYIGYLTERQIISENDVDDLDEHMEKDELIEVAMKVYKYFKDRGDISALAVEKGYRSIWHYESEILRYYMEDPLSDKKINYSLW